MREKQPMSPFLMKSAVALSSILALLAGGLFYYVSVNKPDNQSEALVKVEVGAKACDPMSLTLPSGYHSFEIHNRSDRPVEWEILDGIMVVEERENILPNMKTILRAQLMPGEYQITCGLLSNPRGTLTVTPSEHSASAIAAKPDTRAFIGMLSEYKVFLIMQTNAMLKAAGTLKEALKAQDLEAANNAYKQSHDAYNRTEIISGRFADLSAKLKPAANYLEKREQDPAFTGYYRIEYALQNKQEIGKAEEITTTLINDLTQLKDRLKSVKLTPEMLLKNASSSLHQQAEGSILNGTGSYSGLDLEEFSSQLEGIEKLIKLLQPLSQNPAAEQTADVNNALQNYRSEIATLSSGNTQVAYESIDPAARKKLANQASELAESLDRLALALGLEG
ncbi:iron uptake system protein EfeO [Brucellaceae bacterium C25G]